MDKTYEELEPQLIQILSVGGTFHGKFTCESCGARQTFEKPNTLFTEGICEECNYTTALDKWGIMTILGGL